MPLLKSTGWQIMQILSVLWCVVVSISISLSAAWTIYDNRTLLHVLLQLVDEGQAAGVPMSANVQLIRLVLKGSTGVTIGAIAMGVLSSFAIIVEKRWPAVTFALLNGFLAVGAMVFGVLAFMAKDKAEQLSKDMLQYGIARYTRLDDDTNFKLAPSWRFVVDEMQIGGKCCGFDGYADYEKLFPQVNVTLPTGPVFRNACICRDEARMDCELQHIPLSCCVQTDLASVDLRCATNVFTKQRFSSSCNSSDAVSASPSKRNTAGYHKKSCKEAIEKMPHVVYLKHYAIVNVVIVIATGVLAVSLALLAWKTIARKRLITEEVQIAFKVDPTKAAKLIEEAKEPSLSTRSQSEDNRPSQRDLTQRDVTRLASDRLAPAPSNRILPSDRRRR